MVTAIFIKSLSSTRGHVSAASTSTCLCSLSSLDTLPITSQSSINLLPKNLSTWNFFQKRRQNCYQVGGARLDSCVTIQRNNPLSVTINNENKFNSFPNNNQHYVEQWSWCVTSTWNMASDLWHWCCLTLHLETQTLACAESITSWAGPLHNIVNDGLVL